MLYTSLEFSLARFPLEARILAGVRENEPTLKPKSPQTGIRAMEYTFRYTNFRNHKKTYLGY